MKKIKSVLFADTMEERGFTLVELLVVSPLVMVVAVAAMSFLFNQYGALVKLGGQLNLQLEAQNILFGLQDDLWYANQFSSDLNSNLVDAYQPAGGWTTATTPAPLIVSTAALDKNRRDSNRQPIYINESTCTPPDGNGVNSVLFNNVIYFVSGGSLYKRTVTAPASLPTCGVPYQKQTCPAASATSTCRADVTLSTHINTFTITYYDTNNTIVTNPELAESVKVSIALKDKAYAEDITANSSMRLRKLNQ
jgi:type II secretory pathway pseudopilin PulG